MTNIFDSSAIYHLICRGDPSFIADGKTISLASYETGNIIWKEHNIHKRLGRLESEELIELINSIIDNLQKVNLNGQQSKIFEAASKLNISYYDASYVIAANQVGGTLITEDKKLTQKAASFITIKNCEELLSGKLEL